MLRHSTSNNLDPKDKNLSFHNTDAEPVPARSHFSPVVRKVVGRFFRNSRAKQKIFLMQISIVLSSVRKIDHSQTRIVT
jgi:hypothetical protein